MSLNKETKSEKIARLGEELAQLKLELMITRGVNNRYISGLLNIKNSEIEELLENPVITLPSGRQLRFSDLNEEQLSYLESLANTKKL